MENNQRFNLNKHKEYKINKDAQATSFNRILAYLFDLFIILIASMSLSTLVVQPLLGFSKKTDALAAIDKNITNTLKETRLYIYDDNNFSFINDNDYFVEFIKNEEKRALGEDVINPIYYYYTNYEKLSVNDINKNILKLDESTLKNDYFVSISMNDNATINEDFLLAASNVISGHYTNVDMNASESLKTYVMELVSNARTKFEHTEGTNYVLYLKEYEAISFQKTRISAKSSVIAFFISSTFAYVLIPLIFKKKSFGQMIFKIKVIYQDNEEIRYFDLITRYIMMLPLLIMLAPFASIPSYGLDSIVLPLFITESGKIISFFIPSLASLVINILVMFTVTLTEKKQAYYDRAYGYAMVSYNEKQIGRNTKTEEK